MSFLTYQGGGEGGVDCRQAYKYIFDYTSFDNVSTIHPYFVQAEKFIFVFLKLFSSKTKTNMHWQYS